MKSNRKSLEALFVFGALALVLSLGACTRRQTVRGASQTETAEIPSPSEDSVNSEELNAKAQELDIHGKEFESSVELSAIHFDLDSYGLSEEARKVLFQNAQYLKDHPNLQVLVEGHCDQRGTVAYNLALGQKRASSVQKYYAQLGISPRRIGSVSFGKEKPACSENTENCWYENRRAETKVRTVKISMNPEAERAIIK